MKKSIIFIIALVLSLSGYANQKKKEKIRELRKELSSHPFGTPVLKVSGEEALQVLGSDGRFTDMLEKEKQIEQGRYAESMNMDDCIFINDVARDCFERIWMIAEQYRNKTGIDINDPIFQRLLKSILFYGILENERNDEAPGRFHASCFATPKAAANTYFCLLDVMDRIEAGEIKNELAIKAHKKLMDVAFQSWSQPLRHDETDKNIIDVERFRKHVWWVGGNALNYRVVFETAVMMSSIPMMDVLAEVALKSISVVSQTTQNEAFWVEGMTADGAGWGHGKQCLIWGYPIDGMRGTFRILNYLKNSPWAQSLSKENVEVLMNYIRYSSFYHHKGITPPLVDRGNMIRKNNRRGNIPSHSIARTLLTDWKGSLTQEEIKELEQFLQESSSLDIKMEDYPDGIYHGVRYFYNNDDVIKKTPEYYLFLNMASDRADGLESAYPFAAGYNFYSADGVTLFQRNGDEYRNILGGMVLTAWPGVTTRQTPVELQPIQNWSGFTSKHNFAAGAGNNKSSFAAGFIYEKVNGSRGNDEFTLRNDKNKEIYGVLAYKSYFMFDDLLLALGSGITNLLPEEEGTITTTLEQTFSPAPPLGWKENTPVHVIENNTVNWIQHNGFAYGVLPEYTSGTVKAGRELRKTNWQRLSKSNTEEETEVAVFQMEIDHGRYPEKATYAYIVNCDGTVPDELPVIISNTTDLQAAESADGSQLGAVVFNPEQTIKCSYGEYRVSHPVALFIEKKFNQLHITITDALMDKNTNSIFLSTSFPVKGENVSIGSNNTFITEIKMPGEPHRGAPCSLILPLD